MKKGIILLAAIAAVIFASCSLSSIEPGDRYAATNDHIFKLKNDHKIAYTGEEIPLYALEDFSDGIKIRANGFVGVVKKDGTVVTNSAYNDIVESWEDIEDIAIGYDFIIGLKTDGTLVSAGSDSYRQLNIYDFRDIVKVKAGGTHTVALDSSGRLNAVGNWESGQKNFTGWEDIADFDCGPNSTAAVSKNGRAYSTVAGVDGYDISDWEDIVKIATSDTHTVGLKTDGTLVASGDNSSGQCEVSGLKNIVEIQADNGVTLAVNNRGKIFALGDKIKVKEWK